tara:strand:+ start:37 stop:267 length:231 start_codon:yes stop_codon:yes gene_type:complete
MYKALKGGGRLTLTQQRHRDRTQQLHRERVRNIRANVDNKPPRRHNHLRRNLKKEQMLEGECRGDLCDPVSRCGAV